MLGGAAGFITVLLGLATVVSGSECSEMNRAFLESLVGTWDVSVSTRIAPGEFEQSRGESEFAVGLGGCAVIERYRAVGAESPYSRVAVLTARDDGTFELARLDSEHGSFTVSVGEFDEGALTLTWSRDLGDRLLRTRATYLVDAGDRFHVEHHLSRSEGEPWSATYRAQYRRRE